MLFTKTSHSAAPYRLAILAAGALWSLSGLFIKALTVYPGWHCSALGITAYRSFFAALCLLPLLRGRRLPPVRDLLISIGIYTLLLALYVASAQGTTAANAIFLQYTAPLYALLLGPRLVGEPFRREDVFTLVGAMFGILVLFLGNFHGGEQLPLLMGAGSGLMFGLFLLWLRRMRDADPVAVTALNNMGAAFLCWIALLAVRPEEAWLLPRAIASDHTLLGVAGVLALMGVVQIAAPYALFSFGLRRVTGVEGGLLALVEPLLNPVWVLLFVHERPTPATLLGGAIIVGTLVLRYTVFRGTDRA